MPRCATARRASVTDCGRAHRFDDEREAAHQHLVPLPAHDACVAQRASSSQCPLSGSLSTTWSAPQASAASAWCGCRASTVTGHAGNRPRSAAREANPMMPAPDNEDGLAVGRHGAQQAVAGDGHGLVEARTAVGDGVGEGVEHGVVRQHAVGPPSAEVLGVPERPARADDAAVQVQARRGPAPGAVGAGRVDPPGQARDARVDDDPGPDGDGAVGPGLDDPACRLVAEHEREGPDGGQGGRGPGVVREQMEVAAADPAGRHRDAGP